MRTIPSKADLAAIGINAWVSSANELKVDGWRLSNHNDNLFAMITHEDTAGNVYWEMNALITWQAIWGQTPCSGSSCTTQKTQDICSQDQSGAVASFSLPSQSNVVNSATAGGSYQLLPAVSTGGAFAYDCANNGSRYCDGASSGSSSSTYAISIAGLDSSSYSISTNGSGDPILSFSTMDSSKAQIAPYTATLTYDTVSTTFPVYICHV